MRILSLTYFNLRKYSDYWIPAALLLLLCAFLQKFTGTGFGDPDGWYHLGIAKLYHSGQVTTQLPWLDATILKNTFFDQQFLYHKLLALHSTHVWAQIVTVLVGLGIFTTAGVILRERTVLKPYWWSLTIFLASSGFLFRVNLVKGSMLGVLFFCITILTLLKNKFWLLAPVLALWVLAHGSFVLTIPLVVSYFIIVKTGKRNIGYIILYTALGMVCGYLLHPQHAALIPYLKTQLMVPLSGKHSASVGSEWYAYGFSSLIKYSSPLLCAWISTIVIQCAEKLANKISFSKFRSANTWLGVLSVGWFFLFLSSKRFIEYWVPTASIAVIIACAPYVARIHVSSFIKLLKTTWQVALGTLLLIVCAGTMAWYNTKLAIVDLKHNAGVESYTGASNWLRENTEQDAIIFNTRWDHFPQLFYLNTHNRYIVGLDPLFMYTYNSTLYRKWHVVTDEQPEQWSNAILASIIRNDFNSPYILIENYRSPKLLDYIYTNAVADKKFSLVYHDIYISIFQVNQ